MHGEKVKKENYIICYSALWGETKILKWLLLWKKKSIRTRHFSVLIIITPLYWILPIYYVPLPRHQIQVYIIVLNER